MTTKRREITSPRPLIAGHFYRLGEAPVFFGYGHTAIEEKIRTGAPPIKLTDSGRAKGWFGRTILKWQQEREAAAAKQLETT